MRSGVRDEYDHMAHRMSRLVTDVPGYVSHKGFTADDGERVTIVEFETEEALQSWRLNADHISAKKRGFETFFESFKFQICTVVRERSWVKRD
jgi:heme-degrading monooxygenase HmoA